MNRVRSFFGNPGDRDRDRQQRALSSGKGSGGLCAMAVDRRHLSTLKQQWLWLAQRKDWDARTPSSVTGLRDCHAIKGLGGVDDGVGGVDEVVDNELEVEDNDDERDEARTSNPTGNMAFSSQSTPLIPPTVTANSTLSSLRFPTNITSITALGSQAAPPISFSSPSTKPPPPLTSQQHPPSASAPASPASTASSTAISIDTSIVSLDSEKGHTFSRSVSDMTTQTDATVTHNNFVTFPQHRYPTALPHQIQMRMPLRNYQDVSLQPSDAILHSMFGPILPDSSVHHHYLHQHPLTNSITASSASSSGLVSRSSVASNSIDEMTDDPVKLREALKVSRSANKKLEIQNRKLQRAAIAQRDMHAHMQRILASERESRFVRDRVTAEKLRKLDLELDLEKDRNAVLQRRVYRLEDRVEDLKWRVCTGGCQAALGAGRPAAGVGVQVAGGKQVGSLNFTGEEGSREATATGSTVGSTLASGTVEKLGPNLVVNTAAVAVTYVTPEQQQQHRSKSPVSPEEGYGSDEFGGGDVAVLDMANEAICAIGGYDTPKEKEGVVHQDSVERVGRTNGRLFEDQPEEGDDDDSEAEGNDSEAGGEGGENEEGEVASEEEVEGVSLVEFSTEDLSDPFGSLGDVSPNAAAKRLPQLSPLDQFLEKATCRLVQELQNHVEWETAQMDLDEVVGEFVAAMGGASAKSDVTTMGTVSAISSSSAVPINDTDCVSVIFESFVRVVEDRTRHWHVNTVPNANSSYVHRNVEYDRARMRVEIEKFCAAFPRYDSLFSKYQLDDAALLTLLSDVCVKPSPHERHAAAAAAAVAAHASPVEPYTAVASSSLLRPLMHLPLLMDLYKRKLVGVDSVLEWYAAFEESLQREGPARMGEELYARCVYVYEQCEQFVHWLEVCDVVGDMEIGEHERILNETMSEEDEENVMDAVKEATNGKDSDSDSSSSSSEEDSDDREDGSEDQGDASEDWDDDDELLSGVPVRQELSVPHLPAGSNKKAVSFAKDDVIM
ncbi:hypothetical protein BC830DRAFT_1214972 [Chytriomyces sp. MP71]|nr:hypothetical protein BC830DRAFT_1214972 [Chytriomyces sp. MP71]